MKIRRPRVPANANSADVPRACPSFVVAGLTRLVDGGVFEPGAVEETVMGVVIDATTDEVLVMPLEDAWKRDDEAAGTMLDTDVLREDEMETPIAGAKEVGNAEACACQNSLSACNRTILQSLLNFQSVFHQKYRVDDLPISWVLQQPSIGIM